MTALPQRKFDIDSNEYPFESHWFKHNDTHMHYVDEGEGIPVVMCHGNPTWSFLYRHIIKELAGECRCIAYDLPGFGFSEHPPSYGYTPQEHAEWIEALVVDHLKLDKFILVVQDWGGPTGLDMATKHPDRVLGVVASSTFAWKTGMVGQIFSRVVGGPIGRQLVLKKNYFAKNLVPALLAEKNKNNKTIREAYIAPFPTPESRMGTAVFPKQIVGATPWLIELEKRLHTLNDKPVELIFGLEDIGTTRAEITKWLQHFPNANVQVALNAKHFTQEDCPEKYAVAVRNILSQL